MTPADSYFLPGQRITDADLEEFAFYEPAVEAICDEIFYASCVVEDICEYLVEAEISYGDGDYIVEEELIY